MQHRWCLLPLLAALAGCGAGLVGLDDGPSTDEPDALWDNARPDDGRDVADERSVASRAKRVDIAPGKSQNAERIKLLPVGRSEGSAPRRVVLRLSASEIPKLAVGDRLFVPAEVQATTRCDVGQNAAGCNYNPTIRAQLILTGNASDTSAGGAGSRAIATETLTCTKGEHHCMIVFRPAKASVLLAGNWALPCVAKNSCTINLVMWAWNSAARSGGRDKVLIGGNEGNFLANGRVDGDKARLMVVRERGLTKSDRAAQRTKGGGDLRVNTQANPERVFSHLLKKGALLAGEQFLVEAKLVTSVRGRARFSTKLVLTKNRKAKDGRLAGIAPAEIAEHNGINCLPSRPCVTRRVAVFRVKQRIAGPVYLNIVAKSAVPGGGSTTVVVRRTKSWIRSLRYAAQLGR